MGLNVKSIFNLTRALTPQLEKSKGASVINLGSVQGLRAPALDNFAYSTSKAAVHHLTKHLAIRLADKNIRVNAIGKVLNIKLKVKSILSCRSI